MARGLANQQAVRLAADRTTGYIRAHCPGAGWTPRPTAAASAADPIAVCRGFRMPPEGCIIVANPAAGGVRRPRVQENLQRLAGELSCPLWGLDCRSADEFRQCVAAASARASILVVAGGDGTFADALNAVRADPVLAYLPCGSGNALRWALRQAGCRPVAAATVREARSRRIGVIRCDGGRLALMASIGLDALAAHLRRVDARPGQRGLARYAAALLKAARGYRCPEVAVRGDNDARTRGRYLSVVVSQHPFYGYGLLVNRGGLNDPALSLRVVPGPLVALPVILVAAALRRRPGPGRCLAGSAFTISASHPVWLQCDGEAVRQGQEFVFERLPGHVRLLC